MHLAETPNRERFLRRCYQLLFEKRGVCARCRQDLILTDP
jgi:hypothetical protein